MLHDARCFHLYPPEAGKMHTGTYPKACAQSRDDVERRTRGAGYTLDRCPDCLT